VGRRIRPSRFPVRYSLFALSLLACTHPTSTPSLPPVPATPGTQLALYDDGSGHRYAAIDDRRWVDVAGNSLLVPVDPRAVLASLTIEAVAGGALRLEDCAREPLPAWPDSQEPQESAELSADAILAAAAAPDHFTPAVRCRAIGAPGRYLVRAFYVTTRPTYHAQHEISLGEKTATVTSRFTIETPRWGGRAEAVLYDGLPGGEKPPREVARAEIALDGSTAIVTIPGATVVPVLRRIFDGAVRPASVEPNDPAWGATSTPAVWVWLELPATHLAPGVIRVQLAPEHPGEEQYVDVPATSRVQTDQLLRLPLWIDDTLRGVRQRFADPRATARTAERVTASITNNGEHEAEVFVDEHVRPASRRKVDHAWPTRPSFTGEVLRTKLLVKPGKTERCGFTISYDE
jgi:hypothetical protein